MEAENYLKAVYGITRMLQTPAIEQFLKELEKVPTTDLAHVLSFMHSFNLRFGAAKTPIQEGAYDQLYPTLAALRDRVQAPDSNPYAAQAGQPNPQQVTNFFSGMDFSHFQPQPDPQGPSW